MAYNEEDFLQLSGLQHFRFCRRQWALIHIEHQWAENYRTIDGRSSTKTPTTRTFRSGGATASLRVASASIPRSWVYPDSATYWNTTGAPSGSPSPGKRDCGSRTRWSTSGDAPARTLATPCSYARRPCAWSPCSAATSLRAHSITGISAGERGFPSPRSCAQGCGSCWWKCTSCTVGAIPPRSSPPNPAMPAP